MDWTLSGDEVTEKLNAMSSSEKLEYIPREFRANLEYGSVGESVKLLQS